MGVMVIMMVAMLAFAPGHLGMIKGHPPVHEQTAAPPPADGAGASDRTIEGSR